MQMLTRQTITINKLALGRVKTQGHMFGPNGQHAIKRLVYVMCILPVSYTSHTHNQHVLLVVWDHFPDRNYMFSCIPAN